MNNFNAYYTIFTSFQLTLTEVLSEIYVDKVIIKERTYIQYELA